MHIGHIKEIWRYPVKSLGGEIIKEATLDDFGMIGDRCWSLIKSPFTPGEHGLPDAGGGVEGVGVDALRRFINYQLSCCFWMGISSPPVALKKLPPNLQQVIGC